MPNRQDAQATYKHQIAAMGTTRGEEIRVELTQGDSHGNTSRHWQNTAGTLTSGSGREAHEAFLTGTYPPSDPAHKLYLEGPKR